MEYREFAKLVLNYIIGTESFHSGSQLLRVSEKGILFIPVLKLELLVQIQKVEVFLIEVERPFIFVHDILNPILERYLIKASQLHLVKLDQVFEPLMELVQITHILLLLIPFVGLFVDLVPEFILKDFIKHYMFVIAKVSRLPMEESVHYFYLFFGPLLDVLVYVFVYFEPLVKVLIRSLIQQKR